MEKVKKDSQKMYENVFYILDKIILDIKNRDRQNFIYNSLSTNLYFFQNFLIFRKEKIYYKLEFENKKLYISDSLNGENFGNRTVVGKYDEIKFEKIDNLIKINIKYNEKDITKLVNLR